MGFDWTALNIEAVVNEVRNIWRVDVEPKTHAWRSAEQLTRGAGADVRAALSPDGKRLVYTTERRTARLWVFPLDGAGRRLAGEGIPVTPAEATIGWSDLSPDSQKVGYVMRRPGSRGVDLWTVDVDGGHRELLAQNVVGGSWSRDGTAIGYTLFRDEPEPGQWALAARSLSGPERLLSPWDHQSALLPFDWTADGKAMVGSYYAPITAVPKLVLWSSSKPSAKPERILLAQTGVSFWQSRFSQRTMAMLCAWTAGESGWNRDDGCA